MASLQGLWIPLTFVLFTISSCQGTTFVSEMNGTNVNVANSFVHNSQQCLQCDNIISNVSLDQCGCGSVIDKMNAYMYMTGLANGSYIMYLTLTASALNPTDNVTKAHIHPGNYRNVSGRHTVVFFETPEEFDAQAFKTKKAFSIAAGVGPEEFRSILRSPPDFYMNVHSSLYSVGAIRGQLQTSTEVPEQALKLPVSEDTYHTEFTTGPIQGNAQISFRGDFATLGISVMAIGFVEGETVTGLAVHLGPGGTVGRQVLDLTPAINGSQLVATGFTFNQNFSVPVANATDIAKNPSSHYLQLTTNKNIAKGQTFAVGNTPSAALSRRASLASWKIVISLWVAVALVAATGL